MKTKLNQTCHARSKAIGATVHTFSIIALLAGWSASCATFYVRQGNPNPTWPYDTWDHAATNIQDAVEPARPGDLVLVDNGVYATGSSPVNGSRVAISRAITVQSVNGPETTVIDGAGHPCVYITASATLSGFTLTNGHHGAECESSAILTNCILTGNSAGGGGGALGGTLYNCTLTGNLASGVPIGHGDGPGYGGGAQGATLYNCTLTGNFATDSGGAVNECTLYNCSLSGNTASYDGGGAYSSTLYNCTVTGNSADGGGGSEECAHFNCIVYGNSAAFWPNHAYSTFEHSCTTPLPPGGTGNITNSPLFVDGLNGNLRLQTNSPCINAGTNAYVQNSSDLDGRPRIADGTVDMGAYESQPGINGAFIGWLQQYGLPTDGSADSVDSDLDGHNSWQEWKAWTNPTNASSVLKLLIPQPAANGTVVTWQSVLGQSYSVERATNANGPFSFLQGSIPGQVGTTSVTDTNPADGNAILYRVGVLE